MELLFRHWVLTVLYIFLFFGATTACLQVNEETQIKSLKEACAIKKAELEDEIEYLKQRLDIEKERLTLKNSELEFWIARNTVVPEEFPQEPIYPCPTAPKEWDDFQKELHIVVPPRRKE